MTLELSGSKGGLHLGGHTHSHHGEHVRLPRGLKGPHHIFECRRTNIMGSLVQDASPFLFPCTIEYSLICAAILYVMWKNISKIGFTQPTTPPGSRHHAHAYRYSDNRHVYRATVRAYTLVITILCTGADDNSVYELIPLMFTGKLNVNNMYLKSVKQRVIL